MSIQNVFRQFSKEESKSIRIFLFLLLSIFMIAIFEEQVAVFYNPENHLSFHLILEFISITIAFSIAFLAWTVFPQTLSSYRLYMGLLFFVIGCVDLLHTLTYNGMPYFIMESSVQRATWFWILGRVIEAVFLLLILRNPDRPLRDANRSIMFLFAFIAVVAIGAIVDTQIDRLPVLVIEGEGTTVLKNSLEYFVMAIHAFIIFLVYKNNKKCRNPASLYIILASISIIFAEALFTLYVSVHGLDNFLGHILKVIAYYYFLKSIYVYTLDRPFKAREKAEKQLRESREQYKKLIESLPDAVIIHDNEKLLYANKEFCERFGCNNQDGAIGMPIKQFVHPDYLTNVKEQNRLLLEREGVMSPTHRQYVLANGESIDVEVTAITIMYNNMKSILNVIREVTEQKKLQWELQRTKQLYQSLFDYNTESSFAIDKNGKITKVNDSTVALLGYSKEELLQSSFVPLIHRDKVEHTINIFETVLKGEPQTYQTKAVHKNGDILDLSINNVPVIVEGEITGIIGVARNITESKRQQERLKASEERYKSLIELSLQGIYVHDKDHILFCNQETCKLLAVENSEEIIGKPYTEFLHPNYRKDVDYLMRRVLDGKEKLPSKHEVKFIRSDGKIIEVELGTSLITYDDKQAILCVMHDVTKQKKAQEKLIRANQILDRASRLDGLTNLPNRRYYDEMLHQEWNRAKRSKRFISLLMIDIDYFKKYNDTYGHLQGDQCLQRVANCLKSSIVRTTDFVARYGGEEFSVILPETDLFGAEKVAENIRQRIEQLQIVNEKSPINGTLTVSIGVSSLIPNNDDSYEKMIKQADKALYEAKNNGRNCVRLYKEYLEIVSE